MNSLISLDMSNTKKDIKPIHKKISKRANKAEMQKITSRTLELVKQNMAYRDIKAVLIREIPNKCERQIEKYIQKAFEVLREEFQENCKSISFEIFETLRKEYIEACKQYENVPIDKVREKATWQKLKLETLDRLLRFAPEKVTDDSQVISVEYKVISRDED